MSVVGARLGGAGTWEFRLLPFLFLFSFVELGLDLGVVVVVGGRGLRSLSSFFLRLCRQGFFALLQVLLHGPLMMVEFLRSGEKIIFHCFYLGSNFSEQLLIVIN